MWRTFIAIRRPGRTFVMAAVHVLHQSRMSSFD